MGSWFKPENGLREKGTQYNTHVEAMLNIFLNSHPAEGLGLDAIKNYVGSGVLSQVLKLSTAKEPRNKDEENTCSKDYPTLSKTTFLIHYRVLLHHLVMSVKDNVTFGVTKDSIEQLSIWTEAIRQFHELVSVIRVWNTRPLIGSVIKFARPFLDHFLKHGMPLMDKLFKSHSGDCIGLLKDLQMSTRQLQHICSHSKLQKDVALSNHVPLMKKSLESFVFRVKAMLAVNWDVSGPTGAKMSHTFWVGNLKNRDLKGAEIVEPIEEKEKSIQSDEDEDEANVLPEEDQSDVELSDVESEGNGKSNT